MPGCYHTHEAKMRTPTGLERHSFGVTPNPPPLQPIANPDLRTVDLPPQWTTMTGLILQKGNTEYLPNLPPTLRHLRVEKNALRELPAFPATLRNVYTNFNRLTTLPILNDGLITLNVSHNRLIELPAIPASLEILNLTDNHFTALPSLAATSLTSLSIGNNQLTALPKLPQSLVSLRCDLNEITELQDLPRRTSVIICSRNPLTKLYVENLVNLEVLVANHCQLTELPLLPEPSIPNQDDNRMFYFNDNPLAPEFAAIYQTYREAPIAGRNRAFRNAIKAIYLQRKQQQLSALQRVFKMPMVKSTPQNWYYGPQQTAVERAMYGNYNPTNRVAQFLSGQTGSLEMQKLALLEQREAVGAVPPGTAARARERIANIAVSGGPMAERAKLYLKPENITAARARAAAQAPGGGRRRHRTQRKRKSSRASRKK
jgi:hypothetical protein